MQQSDIAGVDQTQEHVQVADHLAVDLRPAEDPAYRGDLCLLNGQRLTGQQRLRDGDRLSLSAGALIIT
jgi:hypothetical protein